MHKSTYTTLALMIALAIFGFTLAPATAVAQQADEVEVEPEPIAPLPITAVNLRGDVFANGHAIGAVDFAVIFSEDDPSKVQLWAVFNDAPTPICFGDVFDSPQGEPVFLGTTSLMDPAGTCTMSQLPDKSGITLFAASDDGQWASAILRSPDRFEPVPIFE